MISSRRRFLRRLAGSAVAAGLAFTTALVLRPTQSHAQSRALSLDQAKAAGWIGERPDGYVGLVRTDAAADVRALVSRINGERRARYEDVARRTNTTADKVGIVAGEKLINATPRGQFVMTQGGQWVTR